MSNCYSFLQILPFHSHRHQFVLLGDRYMAVSQMEPTDARRAFPCFDEPNMKSTFTVTLGRHRDMTALSNMPLINTTAMQVIRLCLAMSIAYIHNYSRQGGSGRSLLGPFRPIGPHVHVPGGVHCGQFHASRIGRRRRKVEVQHLRPPLGSPTSSVCLA